jgi:hypothetical protein
MRSRAPQLYASDVVPAAGSRLTSRTRRKTMGLRKTRALSRPRVARPAMDAARRSEVGVQRVRSWGMRLVIGALQARGVLRSKGNIRVRGVRGALWAKDRRACYPAGLRRPRLLPGVYRSALRRVPPAHPLPSYFATLVRQHQGFQGIDTPSHLPDPPPVLITNANASPRLRLPDRAHLTGARHISLAQTSGSTRPLARRRNSAPHLKALRVPPHVQAQPPLVLRPPARSTCGCCWMRSSVLRLLSCRTRPLAGK